MAVEELALFCTALLFAVMAVSVANNMGVIIGPGSSTRILRPNTLRLLSIAGLVLGYVIEGWKVRADVGLSIDGEIVASLTVLIFLGVLTFFGRATSITQLMFAFVVGVSIARGDQSSLGFVTEVLTYWLVAIVLSVLASMLITSFMKGRGPFSVLGSITVLKGVTLVMIFLMAYVLGANTLGFVASFVPSPAGPVSVFVALLGIVVGAYMTDVRGSVYSTGLVGLRYVSSLAPYVSAMLLTEVGTQLGVPLPLSMSVFFGLIGSALAMRLRIIPYRKVIHYFMTAWLAPFLFMVFVSWLLYRLLPLQL